MKIAALQLALGGDMETNIAAVEIQVGISSRGGRLPDARADRCSRELIQAGGIAELIEIPDAHEHRHRRGPR